VGVTGTGFWRAPEVLEQVKRRVPSQELVFTEKADVYSFGMMCCKVVTGCIPFEGHPPNGYDVVLSGGRPRLPHDLNPRLKEIIVDCWQHDPQLRPTSFQLYSWIASYADKNFDLPDVDLNLTEDEESHAPQPCIKHLLAR
jgi:serine/threonine protein kinase